MKLILTESQIRQVLKEFDYSDALRLEKAALDFYGETHSPSLAGFITPSGHMIDFSEGSGMRAQDHRNIGFLFDEYGIDKEQYGEGKWKNTSSGGLYAAMDMGFIRYLPESNGFDMRVMPTQEQFQLLRRLFREIDENVILDMADGIGMQYESDTPTEFIFTDIKNYYNHGMIPQPYKYSDEDELYESLIERLVTKIVYNCDK